MAVELRNWIESQIEVNLPVSSLLRSTGLGDLSKSVADSFAATQTSDQPHADEVSGDRDDTEDTISVERADALLGELPDLADDEVTKLLGEMLRQQEDG